MYPFGTGHAVGRAARTGIALALVASALVVAPAAAAPTVTRDIDIHFSRTRHFDADPNCGPLSIAVTEVQEGNAHLVIIDNGTWFNITAHESLTITVIPDDPSIASHTRQVTDAVHFLAQPDGDVIYHESFHDFGPAPWDPDAKIRTAITYVTRDGEVMVDHWVVNDLPPDNC